MKRIVLIAALLMASPLAGASEIVQFARVDIGSEFIVSGVLRKGEDGFTIKLVQMIVTARNLDEANGIFSREVLDQYPGYAVATTLASPLPRKPCGQAI